MTKYFCDKCGIEIDTANSVYTVPKDFIIFYSPNQITKFPDRDYDLCESCGNELVRWLMNKKDVI